MTNDDPTHTLLGYLIYESGSVSFFLLSGLACDVPPEETYLSYIEIVHFILILKSDFFGGGVKIRFGCVTLAVLELVLQARLTLNS